MPIGLYHGKGAFLPLDVWEKLLCHHQCILHLVPDFSTFFGYSISFTLARVLYSGPDSLRLLDDVNKDLPRLGISVRP